MDWSKPDGIVIEKKSKGGSDMLSIKVADQWYFALRNKFKQGHWNVWKQEEKKQIPEEHEEEPIKFDGGAPF